ncbi:MAG: S-layer homology domain-containing protein [Oscillospiraceae bacterium]|nr:S-layer homology domain-containing protein [Oscillospiraceae bacterium]
MKKLVSVLLCICILCSLFAMTASAVDIISDVMLLYSGKYAVGERIKDLGLSTYHLSSCTIKSVNIRFNTGDGWQMVDLEKHPYFEANTYYRYELWIYSTDEHEIFDGKNLPTMSVPEGCSVSGLCVWEDGSLYLNLDFGMPKSAPLPFKDVKTTDWFYKDVEFVYNNKMMNGVGNDLFDPNGTCTRAMVVTVLFRLLGEPGGVVPCPFTDVPDDEWYSQAVRWAAHVKVVNGMTATTFEPNTPVTREQLAAILYRFADSLGRDVSEGVMLAGFTDNAKISDWAQTPLSWAFAKGIITGVDEANGKFLYPQDNASRCQIAAILHRFYEAYKPFPG